MQKSVLVVEDDSMVRSMIVDYLTEIGFLVYEASDGPEALEIIARDHPSLILLDLRLNRMSGLEVLKKTKALAPETVVVVLSGNQEETIAKKAIAMGAYDYLTKPVSLEALEKHIINRIFE